jgi:hypothetical protein
MSEEAPDAKPETPVETVKPTEAPEAPAESEAAESARQEKLQKLIDGTEEQQKADREEADAMIAEYMHEEEAPNANPEGKNQESKPEGGWLNDARIFLGSQIEPFVSNMLDQIEANLEKGGTGGWQATLFNGLAQISLWLNPKAPWAEDLAKDSGRMELFANRLGMQLVKDAEGNYSCTFNAKPQQPAETAPTEEIALEALNLGEGITMESPLTPDLLTKLSTVDATGNEDVQKVKMLSSVILMGEPDRTAEENISLLKATATDLEWKKAFDLADGEVLPQLTEKLKDLDADMVSNGTLQDLLLASQDLESISQEPISVA